MHYRIAGASCKNNAIIISRNFKTSICTRYKSRRAHRRIAMHNSKIVNDAKCDETGDVLAHFIKRKIIIECEKNTRARAKKYARPRGAFFNGYQIKDYLLFVVYSDAIRAITRVTGAGRNVNFVPPLFHPSPAIGSKYLCPPTRHRLSRITCRLNLPQ